jgi:tetratricopeptide (TPR) repeat protein
MEYSLESRCKLVTEVYKISRDIMLTWFDSARSGDLKTMKQLYKNLGSQKSSSLIHATGEGTSYGFVGSTALHWAAANGDLPMMKQLFEWGASPNAQNKGGSTPLHSACSNLRMESVSLLIQKGGNPDISDCCNDTPLDVLLNRQEIESEEFFGNRKQQQKQQQQTQMSAIREKIMYMLQTQSLAMKMLQNQKQTNSWKVGDMKKLAVGCGLYKREEECPMEREELVKVCEMALGHFELQLDLAARSDSAFEKLRAEFEQKLQQKLLKLEAKQTRRNNDDEDSRNDEDDDDEVREAEILSKKAKQSSEKGNQAFQTGDFKTAIQHYTTAISLAPHDATFYSNRAAAYLKLKVPKRALADAKTAASLKPEWAKPYHRWGCAALDLGMLSDAVAAFKLGLERAPGDTSLQSGLESTLKALEEKRNDSDDEDDFVRKVIEKEQAAATSFIPIQERKPWFECVLCENRTRDNASTPCCEKLICGTCVKRWKKPCKFCKK